MSECVLVWRGSCAAEGVVGWGLRAVLGAYVPGMFGMFLLFEVGAGADGGVGSYVLYTHMMRQRRKAMRGKEAERGR